jgi:hypothetical protein
MRRMDDRHVRRKITIVIGPRQEPNAEGEILRVRIKKGPVIYC